MSNVVFQHNKANGGVQNPGAKRVRKLAAIQICLNTSLEIDINNVHLILFPAAGHSNWHMIEIHNLYKRFIFKLFCRSLYCTTGIFFFSNQFVRGLSEKFVDTLSTAKQEQ